jgi:hypothetical protein
MTSSPAPSSTAVRRRPPAPVVAAVVITAILMAVNSFGLVFFGLFVGPEVNPDAGSPSAVAFAAVGLGYSITALASLPGLWRGRRPAWHVLTCVIAAMVLFACYKIFAEGEIDSAVFLAADLVVAALLVLPATRRHVSA